MISKKIIDDSYKILVKKDEAIKKVHEFFNNQSEIPMNKEQLSLITQAILQTCEESSSLNSEFNLNKRTKINQIAKALAKALEGYAQDFVDEGIQSMMKTKD